MAKRYGKGPADWVYPLKQEPSNEELQRLVDKYRRAIEDQTFLPRDMLIDPGRAPETLSDGSATKPGSGGLTVDKLLEAKKALELADVARYQPFTRPKAFDPEPSFDPDAQLKGESEAADLLQKTRAEMPGMRLRFDASVRPDWGAGEIHVSLTAEVKSSDPPRQYVPGLPDGRIEVLLVKAFRFKPGMRAVDVLKWARDLVDSYMRHEVDEWLRVDGHPVTEVHHKPGILRRRS